MKTNRELLTLAKSYIADPEHWCQGVMAMENTEAECPSHSPSAYAFCTLGAIHRACYADGQNTDDELSTLYRLIDTACAHVTPNWRSGFNVADWNDAGDRKHSEVMAAFDLAISNA